METITASIPTVKQTNDKDDLNLDIVRFEISRITEEFFRKNRDNSNIIITAPYDTEVEIKTIVRSLDIGLNLSSTLIDAVVDDLMCVIQQYINCQKITTKYTFNQRFHGRIPKTTPVENIPFWCTPPRDFDEYEVATTHDGIISSKFILDSCIEVFNKKNRGML